MANVVYTMTGLYTIEVVDAVTNRLIFTGRLAEYWRVLLTGGHDG